jgi:hypothetical protein
MNVKVSAVAVVLAALFLSACIPSPQSLIVGKWEVEAAAKITAEFSPDGTAKLTMFGQTLHGTYKLNGDDELVWTVNGRTTKMKIHVTATELELTNDTNQTVKYKRM